MTSDHRKWLRALLHWSVTAYQSPTSQRCLCPPEELLRRFEDADDELRATAAEARQSDTAEFEQLPSPFDVVSAMIRNLPGIRNGGGWVPRFDALGLAPCPSSTDLPFYAGRYNRIGGPGVWYASCIERGAWAELFRHWEAEEISPLEIRRRVGRAKVSELAVLDLTDPDVCGEVGVTDEEPESDGLTRCQKLAAAARDAGFDGPSFPRPRSKVRSPLLRRWWCRRDVRRRHSTVPLCMGRVVSVRVRAGRPWRWVFRGRTPSRRDCVRIGGWHRRSGRGHGRMRVRDESPSPVASFLGS